MSKSIKPVGWFIDMKTAEHYISTINRSSIANRQSQFKSKIRDAFESKMFGKYDDHSEYYLTMEEIDEIYNKFIKNKDSYADIPTI